MFLTIHRAAALAEFIGLRRSPLAHATPHEDRAALLDTLCSTDRMMSMMFNLPSATKSFKFATKRQLIVNGAVSPSAYLVEMATIAIQIQELDEELAQGTTLQEVYDKVLLADSKMRALAHSIPQSWWNTQKNELQPCDLAQYIHHYLLVRIHLHATMRGKPDGQFAYSRSAGIDACISTLQRYLVLRELLPDGFPFTKLLHMQIFTTSTILLLTRECSTALPGQNHGFKAALIEKVVHGLEADVSPSRDRFAVEAASALRTLQAWIDAPYAQEGLTLCVPLLGKVVIGREHHTRSVESGSALVESVAESTSALAPPMDLDQSYMDQTTMDWLLELDMGAGFHDSLSPDNALIL